MEKLDDKAVLFGEEKKHNIGEVNLELGSDGERFPAGSCCTRGESYENPQVLREADENTRGRLRAER